MIFLIKGMFSNKIPEILDMKFSFGLFFLLDSTFVEKASF